jgi:hypothetical protein
MWSSLSSASKITLRSLQKSSCHKKAYLFIVVNRFDQIRDKEWCKRAVLEQIRQLGAHTYEDGEDLVHFVDWSSALVWQLMKTSNVVIRSCQTCQVEALACINIPCTHSFQCRSVVFWFGL